jgi:hypothetical protein
MTMYEYIANTNPRGAKEIIQSYGYKVVNPRSMGANLRMLVAQEGEPALRNIVELHPDKEIILEVMGSDNKNNFLGADGLSGLGLIAENNKNQQAQLQSSDSTKLAMQTNALVMVAAIIIAAAIITNK